jgi:potassium voltage-gated channel KQT-like subfamily protein 1
LHVVLLLLLLILYIIKIIRGKKLNKIFHRFLVVLCCLVIGVICTIGEYEEKITQKFIYVVNFENKKKRFFFPRKKFFFQEICLLIFFASEYVIRVWSAGCRAKFKGWIGRFHFMRTPISLIDLFVVLASSIVIGFHISGRIGSANPGINIKKNKN